MEDFDDKSRSGPQRVNNNTDFKKLISSQNSLPIIKHDFSIMNKDKKI